MEVLAATAGTATPSGAAVSSAVAGAIGRTKCVHRSRRGVFGSAGRVPAARPGPRRAG